ncbi:MAG: diguanylate cyclase [Gammaproteobacteria bacterium]|nr:diguanylate cyclase [Gammaproteobacteria bacterium]
MAVTGVKGIGRTEPHVQLFNFSSEFLCLLRHDGIMAIRNKAWDRFLGYPPEEFGSLSFFDLLHPDDRERFMPEGDWSSEGSLTPDRTGRVRCTDGVYRVVAWSFLRTAEPGFMYVRGRPDPDVDSQDALASQIQQLKSDVETLGEIRANLDMCLTMEEAREVIRRFCADAINGWPGEVWVFNASRNLLELVARWGDSVKVPVKTMEPMDCWGLRGGRTHASDPTTSGLPCKHHHVPPAQSMCIPLKGSNEVIGLLTTWLASPDDDDPMWHSYLLRIAAIAEVMAVGLANLDLRESLRSQSIRDPLTTLFNRRYLEETLDRELARAIRHESTVGLIVLDIDNFKRFNNQFGHGAGDAALIQVGALLQKITRAEDIVCRHGGEEFTVILPGAPLEATIRRANGIVDAIREVVVHSNDGKPLGSLTVSIGVSAFPDHGETRETLVEAADNALYEAKHAGRDGVRVAPAVGSSPGTHASRSERRETDLFQD